MNQTIYRNRVVRSPFQPHPVQMMKEKAMDTQNMEHPIRKEIRKLCGTYQFTATFSEDTDTLATFRNVPGLIAVQCLLRDKDSKPVGKGHGTAILTRLNKGIERTAFICLNASFLSATNNMCKIWDEQRLDAHDQTPPKGWNGVYEPKQEESPNLATDKQKSYLRELVNLNVEDENEREKWMSQLDDLTKEDASEAIQQFAR